MIGVFIAGFVCGVGAVIAIALRLSNRTTAQESVTCYAIGLGGNSGIDAGSAHRLRQIFKNLEAAQS